MAKFKTADYALTLHQINEFVLNKSPEKYYSKVYQTAVTKRTVSFKINARLTNRAGKVVWMKDIPGKYTDLLDYKGQGAETVIPDVVLDRKLFREGMAGRRGTNNRKQFHFNRGKRKWKNSQSEEILRVAKQLVNSNLVSSSRLFAGPNMYPPMDFAAYGVFAFRSLPSFEERKRHLMFCHAYRTTLPNSSTLYQLPMSKQMVTVWPLETDLVAHHLNNLKIDKENICDRAIDSYGFATSIKAIKDAKFSGVDISGEGPFLLAWSPAKRKGKKGFPVLVADFSNVSTMQEAKRILLVWRDKIESDSHSWKDGFIATDLRDKLRQLVDNLGPKLWQVLKMSDS